MLFAFTGFFVCLFFLFMIQIDDTLVSLDVIERYFICDLSHDLSPKAQEVIDRQGVAYIDEEGDTVTSIVNGKDCVFTCYDGDGTCKCAIEKAYREGRVDFYKPVSCHLYPIRVTQYRDFRAVNLHRWDVCKAAEILGKKEKLPVYKFLKEPLIRKFGKEWYDALEQCAQEWSKQKNM